MKLALPETPKKTVKTAITEFLRKKLLLDRNAFAPAFYHNNSWWVRCSAQVWNDVSVLFMESGSGYRTKCCFR